MKSLAVTYDFGEVAAALAAAGRRVDSEDAFTDEQLEAPAAVANGAFPVFGGFAPADVLKLVGGEPVVLELDALAFAPLTEAGQVHHGLVGAAFYFQTDVCLSEFALNIFIGSG